MFHFHGKRLTLDPFGINSSSNHLMSIGEFDEIYLCKHLVNCKLLLVSLREIQETLLIPDIPEFPET